MMDFSGFQLDDTHVLSELEDKDGNMGWWLFTFEKPIIDGVVTCDLINDAGEHFNMVQIDPENFYWNERQVRLMKATI